MASPKAAGIFSNIIFVKPIENGASTDAVIDCNKHAWRNGTLFIQELDERRSRLAILFIHKIRTFHFGATAFIIIRIHGDGTQWCLWSDAPNKNAERISRYGCPDRIHHLFSSFFHQIFSLKWTSTSAFILFKIFVKAPHTRCRVLYSLICLRARCLLSIKSFVAAKASDVLWPPTATSPK